MNEIHTAFETLLKEPKKFSKQNDDFIKELKELLKKTYDFTKSEEIKTIKSNALPKLIIKNFDLEQIWQQIELQNDALFIRAVTNISRLLPKKDELIFKNLQSLNKKIDKSKEDNNEEENENSDSESQDEIEENESPNENDDELVLDDDDNDSSDTDDDDDEPVKQSKEKSTAKKSIVDDEFFKLDEMEKFLLAEEKKLEEPDSGNDSEDEDDDDEDGENEDIDLFEEQSDDENDPAKTARFKDFFVSKDEEKKEKRNKFLEEMDDDEEEEQDEEDNQQIKSTFEERQERLKEKIEEMEQQALDEKPWMLKGEVTADKRPVNSLLEEVVEFEMTTRPAPVITEQTTLQLEDIIKQRIKDKTFDSVERKIRPVETPLEYKKKLVLDQEKSKESLAQIYEKEYLEQKAALDPENQDKPEEVPKLHLEIDSMMTNLFNKLDALSNFHFTPKPAVPELKIINNLPAISMEEVAPVGTSDAQLLAPQEVKKPVANLIGKNERTDTDKKRERRRKKQKQSFHAKLKTKDQKEMEAKKEKNKKSKIESAVPKSSKAFFSQLEDQVKSQIQNKTAPKRKNDAKNGLSVKKLKM